MKKTSSRARNAAIGAILLNMFSMGGYMTISVYLVPLSQSLNASVGQLALLFTISGLTGFFTAMRFGSLLKRFKVKLLVTFASVCMALFYLSFFIAKNVFAIYAGSLLFGFASIAGGTVLSQTVITWWFDKGRAKIISYINLALGVFTFFLAPGVAQLIIIFGVQIAALIQGLVTAGTMLLIGVTLLSEQPVVYGMKPAGYEEPKAGSGSDAEQDTKTSLSVQQMVKTVPFWLLSVAIFFIIIVLAGYASNASAIFQSMGIDAVKAAFCLSIYNMAALVWAPLYGFIADKKGPGAATFVLGAVSAIAFVVCVFVSDFYGAVFVAAFVAAIGFGNMLGALSLPATFGTKEAASLIGFAGVISTIGGMLGAPIAGFIFDATGNYDLFLWLCAILVGVGTIFVVIGTGKKSAESIKALHR